MENTGYTSTLSKKYQVVIPKKIRKELGLKSGRKLIWSVSKKGNEKKAEVVPAPESWTKYMSGLGKGIWSDVDIDKYIDDLRNEWDDK